ncbi:MAG TPA: DUF2089 domain-containing protein [Chloroflexota bacterium]|nr:DUF2089 domain-containing protein [Chloroflexota bacterium]
MEQTDFPTQCPVCRADLHVTRLQCPACSAEVSGDFTLNRLATLGEPHASLIEMFLRSRGNMKEMERDLGLSYPTVRARLEEALTAAGFGREADPDRGARRAEILDALERGEITAQEAAARLRDVARRS